MAHLGEGWHLLHHWLQVVIMENGHLRCCHMSELGGFGDSELQNSIKFKIRKQD